MTEQYNSAYRDRDVCVTGGAGFIGSHLARALVGLGARVRVLDDLSNGSESNLADLAERIRLIRGSILDPIALEQATVGTEMIFHEAAMVSVPRSVDEPILCHEINATGTMRVLEAARAKAPDCRVIFAASSSAYGDLAQSPKVETMCPQPLSPYAASKLAGEHMVAAYAHTLQVPAISLRYFNIFGPNQRGDTPYAGVIPIFINAMREGRSPTIFGDGTQTRDFTFVANAVHANLLAGACPREKLVGQSVNVGCGRSYSLLELVARLGEIMGVEPKYELAPARVGDVKHSCASIDLAGEVLGYEPIVAFEQGLAETVRASLL
jgi:UDP-glucose 4-epimerase